MGLELSINKDYIIDSLDAENERLNMRLAEMEEMEKEMDQLKETISKLTKDLEEEKQNSAKANTYMSAEELGVQNHICLLPCKKDFESRITEWTAKDLKPYQLFLVNGKANNTLFKGLIFNPISVREDYFIKSSHRNYATSLDQNKEWYKTINEFFLKINSSFRNYATLLAGKKEWNEALDNLFLKNFNFDAAATNTEIGKKTDIWVTLPYPNHIIFKQESDRLNMLEWWIEMFLMKWKNAYHLHEKLSFKGFVWPRASIDRTDKILVKSVTEHIRKNGFLSLWLQQYGSSGCVEWSEFGFDASCTHPNYYGKIGPDFAWISNTTVFAKHYHIGMQISFGKGFLFQENHELDYLNYGVYNDYMKDSLLVFHFPNQTINEIYENNPDLYNYLFAFINKSYKPVYPTAAFPFNVDLSEGSNDDLNNSLSEGSNDEVNNSLSEGSNDEVNNSLSESSNDEVNNSLSESSNDEVNNSLSESSNDDLK